MKRINRLFNPDSKNIIMVPLDHGVTLGPIKGLHNIKDTISNLIGNNVDSIVLHKGIINTNIPQVTEKNLGLIMHLSGSTNIGTNSTYKILTGTVYEALAMGCDAVSVHVNVGADKEPEMLKDLAYISSECLKYGMPLMAMMYSRGDKIVDEYDPVLIRHAARIGAELGADLVKVSFTGNMETFSRVVEACPVPIVLAGGAKTNDMEKFLKMVHDGMQAGARGVSIGRNVFQSDQMDVLLNLIGLMVHKGKSLEEVLDVYKNLTGVTSLAAVARAI
jgi:predicted phospho-2-dehydro-3-deoxyheptonate aldolase